MSRHVTMASWEESPHLTDAAKAELLASIPPYQRDARSKGVPQLGSGAIYPVPESDFVVEPFKIPSWYPRAYGMDVGWRVTAAVFGAHDAETDTAYVFAEYYRETAEPSVHAGGIRAVAKDWMMGAIDPASRGRGQRDGQQLFTNYQDLGLLLATAQNGVEAGLFSVWERLTTGRLKVFSTCVKLLGELRLYRRDERGNVVKSNDHACDALRYYVVSGIGIGRMAPDYIERSGLPVGRPRHEVDYDPLARSHLRNGR